MLIPDTVRPNNQNLLWELILDYTWFTTEPRVIVSYDVIYYEDSRLTCYWSGYLEYVTWTH